MQRRSRLAIGSCLIIAIGTAIFAEAIHFYRLSWFFLQLLPTSDSQLYLAMGRGWLNGLAFYRDLFETKPPLVFLIAALALRLGGGFPLFVSFQLVLIVSMAPMLAFLSYKILDRSLGLSRWLVIALSFLLGLTITVATLSRTYGYQVEGFALFFATFPAVLFAWPATDRKRFFLDLTAGASLACAAMLKEPFVGSSILALAVYCQSRRDLYRAFRILVIGGLLSIAILLVSGSLAHYFSLYLPEIFHGRAIAGVMYPDYGQRIYYIIPSPLWSRTLDAFKVFTDLATPLPSLLLALFFGACLCVWAPLRQRDSRLRAFALTAGIFATVLIAGHHVFLLQQLVSGLHATGHAGVSWRNPIIVRLLCISIGTPMIAFVALLMLRRWYRWPPQLTTSIAFALLSMFAATALVRWAEGTIDARYLVFAFPLLACLGTSCLINLAKGRQYILLAMLSILLIGNALSPGQVDYVSVEANNVRRSDKAEIARSQALAIDRLLTNCRQSRYLVADVRGAGQLQGLFAFTIHSPYQITYGMFRAMGAYDFTSATSDPNQFLAGKLENDLRNVFVVVATAADTPQAIEQVLASPPPTLPSINSHGSIITMDAQSGSLLLRIPVAIATVMRDHFATTPPPCAVDIVPIEGLQVFFRKS